MATLTFVSDHMNRNSIASVPAFMSQKRGIGVFLLLYLIASIIFLFIYHPLGLYNDPDNLPIPIDAKIYLIILLSVGYIILVVSRVFFYHAYQKHPDWSLGTAMLWNSAEMMVVILVVTMLGFLLRDNDDVTVVRMLVRVSLDTVGLYCIPMFVVSILALLDDYVQKCHSMSLLYDSLKDQTDSLHRQLEFVNEERALLLRQNEEQTRELNALKAEAGECADTTRAAAASEQAGGWPYNAEFLLTFKDRIGNFDFALPIGSVLFIESVDNYINVYYNEEGRLNKRISRNTMKALEAELQRYEFSRCHRQFLVNNHNIKAIVKEKEGVFIQLSGCERVIPISKTYMGQFIN